MTARDDVWGEVIRLLVEEGQFQVSDLDIDESKRHTVRRVCKEMEEMGYLRRESNRSKTWKAGELANLHLDLSMRAMVNAGFDENQ